MVGRVVSLNVGQVHTFEDEDREWTTGIFKKPVDGPQYVALDGFEDDAQADLKHHGGQDKAVCCFCVEHLPAISEFAGHAVSCGIAGENLSTEGLTEADVCIGDVFAIGSAVLQVSQPRQPCWKFARKVGNSGLIKWMGPRSCSGYYLRVLEPGEVTVGDAMNRIEQKYPALTVKAALESVYSDSPDLAILQTLVDTHELADMYKSALVKRIQT